MAGTLTSSDSGNSERGCRNVGLYTLTDFKLKITSANSENVGNQVAFTSLRLEYSTLP